MEVEKKKRRGRAKSEVKNDEKKDEAKKAAYIGDIRIENIVASVKLDLSDINTDFVENNKLKLGYIAEKGGSGISYDKSNFPGLVYRIKEPKVAMLIFSSGSVICTGARKEEDVYVASTILEKKLREIGVLLNKKPTVVIQNIVASTMFEHCINLDVLSELPDTEYEPEQFPGLMYRLSEPKTVMLIFRSGRIVVTGAKSTQEAILAAKKTKALIVEKNAIIPETK